MGLGLALGLAVGCLRKEDNFVEQYATELCDAVRDCGATLTLPGGQALPVSSACEGVVEAHYLACGDRCEYQPRKARRCIRRLRRNSDCDDATVSGAGGEQEDEEFIPLVCDEVYTQCSGDDDLCRAPTCAVMGSGHREGLGWALGLFALGLVGRRRRV